MQSFKFFIAFHNSLHMLRTSYTSLHTCTGTDLCFHPFIVFLRQYTQAKQLLHTAHILIMYFFITHTHTQMCKHINLKIQPERLLCGIQSQCSRLESLSAASDVTSARSVSCSPPPSSPPFLFPILFHQLSPSFDTSEGVPHMPVTSPLPH